MILEQAIALVHNRVNDTEGYSEEIKSYFERCQEVFELEQFKPWFLEEEMFFELTTEGYLNIPADFLGETRGRKVYLLKDSRPEGEIKKIDIDTAIGRFGLEEGKVICYASSAKRWWFYRRPTEVADILMPYYRRQPIVTTTNDSVWLKYASDLLIEFATRELGIFLKEPDIQQIGDAGVAQAWRRITNETYYRDTQNKYVEFNSDGP